METPDISTRNPFLVYLLPFLHLGACIAIWIGHVNTGWQILLIVDFPFSVVLAGLMFRDVNQLLNFGVLGTLWWYAVSLAVGWFFRSAGGMTRKDVLYVIDVH